MACVRPDRAVKKGAWSESGTQRGRGAALEQGGAEATSAEASNLVVSEAGAGFESAAGRAVASGRRASEGCGCGERKKSVEAVKVKAIAAPSASGSELADGSNAMPVADREHEVGAAWRRRSHRRAALGRSSAARHAQEAGAGAWPRHGAVSQRRPAFR